MKIRIERENSLLKGIFTVSMPDGAGDWDYAFTFQCASVPFAALLAGHIRFLLDAYAADEHRRGVSEGRSMTRLDERAAWRAEAKAETEGKYAKALIEKDRLLGATMGEVARLKGLLAGAKETQPAKPPAALPAPKADAEPVKLFTTRGWAERFVAQRPSERLSITVREGGVFAVVRG